MQFEVLYLSSVFLAGLFSFFSPCIVPLLPVYFSVFASSDGLMLQDGLLRKKQIMIKSLWFVLGISACFILLGFGAGILGSWISSRWFRTAMGIIIILLGLHQTGLIHFPLLYRERKIELKTAIKNTYLKTFLLGLTFSFGWTPCIGPILGAILSLSAAGVKVTYSIFLMMVYALGLLIPFLILAVFSDTLLIKLKILNRHLETIKIIGGVILILMGLIFLSGQFNRLAALFY